MEAIRLVSGHTIPVLGLGTWALRGRQCKVVVKKAIDLGYTHIDTAWMYENQRAIGEALQEIGAARDELFITSKIHQTHLKYNEVLSQCEECLEQLQTDYVDLLLIHHPGDGTVPMEETLSAFKEIYDARKAASIGISNFSIDQVDRARAVSQVPISTNQVEYHAHHGREDLLQHCHKHQIILTAHRPLAVGRIVSDPTLKTIGEKHGKTAAQVALRWLLQKGLIVIPKASSDSHLRENLALFDWELTPEEMQDINGLSKESQTA